jgi:hypothetical protein
VDRIIKHVERIESSSATVCCRAPNSCCLESWIWGGFPLLLVKNGSLYLSIHVESLEFWYKLGRGCLHDSPHYRTWALSLWWTFLVDSTSFFITTRAFCTFCDCTETLAFGFLRTISCVFSFAYFVLCLFAVINKS